MAAILEEPHPAVRIHGRRQPSVHQPGAVLFDGDFRRCRPRLQQAPVTFRHFRQHGGTDANAVGSPRLDPENLLFAPPDQAVAVTIENHGILAHVPSSPGCCAGIVRCTRQISQFITGKNLADSDRHSWPWNVYGLSLDARVQFGKCSSILVSCRRGAPDDRAASSTPPDRNLTLPDWFRASLDQDVAHFFSGNGPYFSAVSSARL